MKLRVIRTENTNPYENLAAEEYMTSNVQEDEVILFLWQNEKTVVIGKNQNPWRECNVERIKADGVRLARRMSGGGAVYHDMGNLNFTFIARDDLYDINKQTDVILLACRLLGINATKNGRNDLVIDERKFSGHAYYSSAGKNYHHGTIMVNVNDEDMPKYLRVSDAKLQSKGVASVRSRVVNLADYLPWKQTPKMVYETEVALIRAFGRTYGGETVEEAVPEIPQDLIDKYSSEEWRYGTRIAFEKEIEHRFDWGEVQVQLAMKGGNIDKCRIYSDSLETEMFGVLEGMLAGCRYDATDITNLEVPAGISDRAHEVLGLIASSID